MLTAEQKVRLTLTGSPFGEPHFQHEGETVVRWITGGTLPDVYVTFHPQGDTIEIRCTTCRMTLGHIATNYGDAALQQLISIRQSGHLHKD